MKSRKLRVYWQIFKDSHFRLDESGKVNGRFRPLGCQGSQIWVGIQSVGNPKWPLREALNLRIKILFGSIRTETSMKASNDICLFKTSTGVNFSQKFELWHRTFQNFVWSSKAILKEKSFSQCEYLSFLYFLMIELIFSTHYRPRSRWRRCKNLQQFNDRLGSHFFGTGFLNS